MISTGHRRESYRGRRMLDITRLSDLLGRMLSQHLGIGVDYRAAMMPNELGIYVEMISPEWLRGLRFVFREGEPLPPQIMVAGGRVGMGAQVEPVRYTYQPDPGQWVQQWVQVNATPGIGPPGIGAFTPIRTEIRMENNMPTMTVERTPLQEARLRELEARGRNEAFVPEVLTEYHNLRAMAPCSVSPVPVPQRRIRVRVIRDDNGYWAITVHVGGVAKELPKVAIIKALLPPGEKHFIPNRQGRYRSSLRILQDSLSAGLSAQALHDSLKAWAIATEGAATNVQSDSPIADESQIELLRAQPATLEVGGKVYKLVPCGEIDVRPLITRVRTRALATARVEGEAIKTRATTDARLVVSQAEASAQAIRRAVEDERRRLGNPVPEWVKLSGREHKWDGSNWNVMLRISCKVDKVRLMVSAWETILWWNSLHPQGDSWYMDHKMPVWLRLHPDGVYTLNDVSMKGEWECTHIASYCCMELQGLPAAITSNDLCVRLENGLSRGMRIVNLNSPLGMSTQKYWPDFKAQIPTVPLGMLSSGRHSDTYLNPGRVSIEDWKAANLRVRWDSEESTRQAAEGVFTVREDTNATTR